MTIPLRKSSEKETVHLLPPFSFIRDFGKQNTRGNVSKISVSLCYQHIGSKSTNNSPLAWYREGQKVTLLLSLLFEYNSFSSFLIFIVQSAIQPLGCNGFLINNNNIFISFIKYTSITPPANSKANRGRWCEDGLRINTIVEVKKRKKSTIFTIKRVSHESNCNKKIEAAI